MGAGGGEKRENPWPGWKQSSQQLKYCSVVLSDTELQYCKVRTGERGGGTALSLRVQAEKEGGDAHSCSTVSQHFGIKLLQDAKPHARRELWEVSRTEWNLTQRSPAAADSWRTSGQSPLRLSIQEHLCQDALGGAAGRSGNLSVSGFLFSGLSFKSIFLPRSPSAPALRSRYSAI